MLSYWFIVVAGLSHAELQSAAQTMEELHMVDGDVIIQQDDVGDCFFVLEEGMVEITVSSSLCVWNKLDFITASHNI